MRDALHSTLLPPFNLVCSDICCWEEHLVTSRLIGGTNLMFVFCVRLRIIDFAAEISVSSLAPMLSAVCSANVSIMILCVLLSPCAATFFLVSALFGKVLAAG